jgi:hypothetical protein
MVDMVCIMVDMIAFIFDDRDMTTISMVNKLYFGDDVVTCKHEA